MLPNLLVVGAMKSGTTSLHHYLSLHPEIFMSEDKEPTFFTVEKNWHRGVSWYSSLFPSDEPVRGESSPDYTKFPAIDGVPERIHSVVPDTRIVYLVREPVERVVSHYIDAFSFGRVHKPIDRELANFEDHHFVNCSRYHMQLEQYLEHFERDRILVITSEALRAARQATMRAVFEFLGVDPSFSSPAFEEVHYTAEEKRRNARLGYVFVRFAERVRRSSLRPYLSPKLMAPIRSLNARTARPIPRPELDASLRRELVDYLRPDVERLRALTNDPFSDWHAFT
ncbi:MAG: sulfotransferase domain-containing protein [Gemmatimonadota bacterium]